MAYTRLLRAYYRRERPIADVDKYRLTRAQSRIQRAAIDTVLTEFFELKDGHWHNKRADEEIGQYQLQSDTNRHIARTRKRGRIVDESLNEASHEPLDEACTKGIPNHKPEPEPRTRTREKQSAGALDWLPPEWSEFVQHRKEKRQTLTPTAERNCIAKLARWRAEGKDVAAIIRHSMEQGYTGLFEPSQRGNRGVQAGNIAAAQEWLRREEEKDREISAP
jgi:uncharacterized protein YdaU (DUF1376 family)